MLCRLESLEPRTLLATVPAGFVDQTVATGMVSPTSLAFTPDGRILVTSEIGYLRVVKNGQLLNTPALSLNVDSSGERGLLSVTVDPNFSSNHFIYIYYTPKTSGSSHNRVSRFTMNGDSVDPSSEKVLLDLPTLISPDHMGGGLHFGKDGKLYLTVGDNKQSALAQSLNSVFGKMLRFNSDGSIPTDNPFYNKTTGINRAIYALGFRNPFTFDVDPVTGKILVADVGENTWEEIDNVVAGGNYGWPNAEGPSTNPAYINPLYSYGHENDQCAIIGAAFYRGSQFPASFDGAYFFGDYCAGWIEYATASSGYTQAQPFLTGLNLVGTAVGPDGALYYLEQADGNEGLLGKVTYDTTYHGQPIITGAPASQTVNLGESVTFKVNVTSPTPVTYQWRENGRPVDGATGSSFTIPLVGSSDANASIDVIVTNNVQSVTSGAATLSIKQNDPPSVIISSPKTTTTYKSGSKISFSGSATDSEDGKLKDKSLTWTVSLHDGAVVTPITTVKGKHSGSFKVLGTDASADAFYEIALTATDSNGASTTITREIHPQTVSITLASNIAGASLSLDNSTVTSPFTFTTMVGFKHFLQAPTTETVGGIDYIFKKWTPSKKRIFNFSTPTKNGTFIAVYAAAQ